jgi:tetratricopeptide (TPR) repeat protein
MIKRLLLLVVMLVGLDQSHAFGDQAARVLVMPFESTKGDGRLFWLGEACAVLLADDLNTLGEGAITREERRRAFERLQMPPVAALSDATVIRIGQLVGAEQVILGSLGLENDSFEVRARAISLDTGRLESDVLERGPLADLYAIVDRIAERIVSSPAAPSTLGSTRPPVAAFENYIKGLLAEAPETAIAYLNAALKISPAFDQARLALWDVYSDQGNYVQALEIVQAVAPDSAWAQRAHFLAGLAELNLKKFDDAFATYKSLADAQPVPAVLNNLGIVQVRRGSTPQTGLPMYYFNKAEEGDPDDPDYLFNLGYAYWLAHDLQGAIYWLRETVRHNAADGEAHFILGTALASSGNSREAAREKELARRLSSTYDLWDRRPASDPIPRGLERVKTDMELPHAQRIETALESGEQRDQQELARFYFDRGRRLFEQERDRDALIELNRALYLSPYFADAHILAGQIHLRNGRVPEAIDAFKISIWSAETAEAHAALGEAYRQANDLAAARTEAERALALDRESSKARRLLDMLKSP